MQLHIHSSGMQLTAAIKAMAEEKFGRLNRLLTRFEKSDLFIDIELSKTTHHHNKGKIFRAEINVPIGRKQVFGAAESDDLYEAMDHCVNTAKRQLVKMKEKADG